MGMMRVAVWLFLFCLTPVWAISYTVQVVAFSDEPRARRVQTELSSQGYPAYLLAVPTAQGQVYRIRVGAFANRAAAALFAEAMPSVEGSTPSPALAEGGVPPGLIPFEPALLGQYDLSTTLVQVFPWPTKSESSAPNVAPQQAAPQQASSEATTAASETSGQETGQDSATQSASDGQQASETANETSTETATTNPDATTTGTSRPNESSEQTTSQEATAVAQTSSPDETSPATTTGSELNAQAVETQQAVSQPLIAIRVQPRDASEQAHYRIGELEFDAWKAAPSDTASSNAAPSNLGEIVRVRSLSVWPEEWQSISEAERDQYRETVLANVAGELDLTPQQLEPFVFELADKAPFVVLVERFNLETQQTERLRAIGQPRPNEDNLGLRNDGPSAFFGESVQIPLPEASTVFEPSSSSQAPDELTGNGWLASSDGDYVNLTVAGKTWRAAIGEPLWASGDLLISIHDNQVLIYQFQEP
jgi:SPOR domain